jgi:predicted peptidase
LFLHGLGESGDDLDLVLDKGLPPYVSAHPHFPFVVIAPQCPRNTWWPELQEELEQLIEACTDRYPIDKKRLYLTGMSMGGYGAWYYGATWPHRFAAVVPICGGGTWFHGFPERVRALKDVPVWAFHGARDDVVPLSASAELVNELREHDGNVKFTVYPEAGHDSWTDTYNNPRLYEWLLAHTLKERPSTRATIQP